MRRRGMGMVVVLGVLSGAPEALAAAPPPPVVPANELPPPLAEPPSPAPHNNPDMMVAGIVISSVGIVSVPVGLVLLTAGGLGAALDGGAASERAAGAGATLFVLGLTVFPAVGIPLWVNGAKAPKRTWAQPVLVPGARSVALRWTLPL